MAITHIRPEDGQEEPDRFDLFCSGCQDDAPLFVLRIRSMRATRVRRYAWGFNVLLASMIFAFGLIAFERIRDEGPLVAIGCLMLIYTLRRWWNEDGVEICTRQRGHRLLWR